MATTRQHRFVAFLAACAAWLLARSVSFWPTLRAGLRTCCYLWPSRHASHRNGARLPPRHVFRRALAQPPKTRLVPSSSSSWHLVRVPPPSQRLLSPPDTLPSVATPSPRRKAIASRPGGADPSLPLATTATTAAATTIVVLLPLSSLPLARLTSSSRPQPKHPRHGPQTLSQLLAAPHELTCCRYQPPPGAAAAAGGPATAAAVAAEAAPWRRYAACTAARTVRYKIHGYDPIDLRHGWQARLAGLVQHNDAWLLAGAHVRPGCVELTLDFLMAATTTTSARSAGIWGGIEVGRLRNDAGGPQRAQVAPVVLPLPHSCVDAQAQDADPAAAEIPDVKRVLGALGLDGGGAGAGNAAPGAEAAMSEVEVQVLGMEPACADAPRVTQMSPRVLLLPGTTPAGGCGQVATRDGDSPRSACEQGLGEWSSDDGDDGEADGRSADAVPAVAPSARSVLLRATVCRPAGRDGRSGCLLGAPAVFARGHSEILSAHVARFQAASVCTLTHGSDDQSSGSCGGGSGAVYGDGNCERYELDVLLALPRRAGVVLVELSWHNQPGQVVPLLALPATEAAVALELQSLAACMANPPAAPSLGTPLEHLQQQHQQHLQQQQQQRLLDNFLLDAGVWTQTLPQSQLQVPRAGAAGLAPQMQLPVRQRAVLGTNLLSFAIHSKLQATEAWIIRGLLQLEPELAAAAEEAGVVAADAPTAAASKPNVEVAGHALAFCAAPLTTATATAAAMVTLLPMSREGGAVACCCGGDGDSGAPAAAAMDEQVAGTCRVTAVSQSVGGKGAQLRRRYGRAEALAGNDSGAVTEATPACVDGAASKPSGSAAGWALWLHALLRVLGLSRASADPAEEEEAFRAYRAPWEANQEHIIQAFECAALLALLFRARADLLSPVNLTSLLAGLPGAITAVGYRLLPRRAWERLVAAVKLPRYLIYMAAKALAVYLNRPLPPGVTSYQLGLVMVLHEGLLLPLACLLPLRAAAFVTVLKVLPCVAMSLMSDIASSRRHAGLRCAAVAAVALPATILCHTYLRVCFARWRRRCGDNGGGGGTATATKLPGAQ